jgi:DNA mismatch repair protein MutS2
VEKAQKHLNPEKQEFENLLKNAERIRNESLKELETARLEREELDRERIRLTQEGKKLEQAMQKVKSNAVSDTRRLVSSSMQKADEIIERMKELRDNTDGGSYLEVKKLRKQLEGIEDEYNKEEDFTQYVPLSKNDIRTGASCLVKSLQAQGVILSSPDKKGYVQVRCGNITTKVKIDDLAEAKAEKEKPKPQIKASVKERNVTTFLTELKVLGMTVDEAIGIIEPYLINMYENEGNKTIKIVHGKGTMALAKGLHRYFKNLPIVLEFRYGRYGEGDNGVTFVTVK